MVCGSSWWLSLWVTVDGWDHLCVVVGGYDGLWVMVVARFMGCSGWLAG